MTTSKGKGQGSASKAPRDAAASLGHGALLEALRTLLEPIAALAVARGVPYAEVDEIVKRAFVDAARAAQPDDAGSRLVSRISTATGLNRREVTRLSTAEAAREAPKRSSATQVFTRWVAEAGARPSLRTLARQGPAPSFEALARSVTNDVHPRSLLDELCRLGLARVDSAEGDTVQLVHESFVPKDDRERMFGFLGANVGDHLRAAVGNVMSSEPVHLEQAMFADELSRESMEAIDTFVRTQWKALMAATVPRVNQQIEADNTKNRQRDQRVRIGMYMYSTTMSDAPTEPPTEVPTDAPKKSSPRRR
jgi:hypothetical protein